MVIVCFRFGFLGTGCVLEGCEGSQFDAVPLDFSQRFEGRKGWSAVENLRAFRH